jgi:hypothetical protein
MAVDRLHEREARHGDDLRRSRSPLDDHELG